MTSIPMTVGSKRHDDHAASPRSNKTLSEIPARKTTTAEACPSAAPQSRAAAPTVASTRLPVTCPVKVLAMTKPAASPYPPTSASPKDSHSLRLSAALHIPRLPRHAADSALAGAIALNPAELRSAERA